MRAIFLNLRQRNKISIWLEINILKFAEKYILIKGAL